MYKRQGHAQHAARVAQVVRHAVSGELALNAVAGAAHARPLRAAALDHETGDHAVEDQAVIKTGVCETDEVAHALRCDVGIELGLSLIHI